jgi:hypothetical protein
MRQFTTNITSDELKTIMATSAIAAAGAAMATALVTYALDRWVLKSEAEEGPMFVVVPVVEREVPPLPPVEPPAPVEPQQPPLIAGYGRSFGALSAQQVAQIRQQLPWRYWEEFYQCWANEDPAHRGHCAQLLQMYEGLDDDDQGEMDDVVSEVPNVGKAEYAATVLATAGAGVAVGMLIALAITR